MKTKLGELLVGLSLPLTSLSKETGLSKSYLSRLASERSLKAYSSTYLRIKKALIEHHKSDLLVLFGSNHHLDKSLDNYFFPPRHGLASFLSPDGKGFVLSLSGSSFSFVREVLSSLSPILRKDRSAKVRILLPPDYGKEVYSLSEAFFFLFLEGRISFFLSDSEPPSFAIVGNRLVLGNANRGKKVFHFLEVDGPTRSFYESYFLSPEKGLYLQAHDFAVAYSRFLAGLRSSDRGLFLLENPSFFYMGEHAFSSFASRLGEKTASLLESSRNAFRPIRKTLAIRLDGLSYKMNKSDPLVDLLSGYERPLSEEEYRAYLSGLPSLSGRSCSLFRLRNTIFSSIVILDGLVAIFPRRYAIKEASIIFDDPLVVKAFQANCRKEIRLERLKKKDLLAVLPV